jgi:hypothetical protein
MQVDVSDINLEFTWNSLRLHIRSIYNMLTCEKNWKLVDILDIDYYVIRIDLTAGRYITCWPVELTENCVKTGRYIRYWLVIKIDFTAGQYTNQYITSCLTKE